MHNPTPRAAHFSGRQKAASSGMGFFGALAMQTGE